MSFRKTLNNVKNTYFTRRGLRLHDVKRCKSMTFTFGFTGKLIPVKSVDDLNMNSRVCVKPNLAGYLHIPRASHRSRTVCCVLSRLAFVCNMKRGHHKPHDYPHLTMNN